MFLKITAFNIPSNFILKLKMQILFLKSNAVILQVF